MRNNIIDECEKYMLCGGNYLTHKQLSAKSNNFNNRLNERKDSNKYEINNKSKEKKENKENKENKEKKENKYLSQDKLFWCFYIILNGHHNYEFNNSFKQEKEFKIECIEKLREIKSELKALKISLNHVENELLNERKIGLQTLIAL